MGSELPARYEGTPMSNDQPWGPPPPANQPVPPVPPAQPYGQPPAQPYGQPAAPAYGQPAYPAAPPAYGAPGAYPAPPAYGAAPAYQGGYGQAGQPGFGPQGELAHWGLRVAAYIIDNLVASAALILAYIVALATGSPSETVAGQIDFSPIGAIAILLGYVVYLGVLIWNRWITQGRTGKSIGKKAMKLRLAAEATGMPPGAGNAFLRDVLHILDSFFYIGYLFPLWDPKRQTFSDKIMKTLVYKD